MPEKTSAPAPDEAPLRPAAGPALIWLRDDLRLKDNPALWAASQLGPVALVYILEVTDHNRPLGAASLWWLHHGLTALRDEAARFGVPLILKRGDPLHIIPSLISETGSVSVHWTRRYHARGRATDTALKKALQATGIAAQSHKGSVMVEPWEVKTGSGGPYKVFSPFFRAAQPLCDHYAESLLDVPPLTGINGVDAFGDDLKSWKLLPQRPDWSGGLQNEWTSGAKGAQARLAAFLDGALKGYKDRRNLPGIVGTSKLSPHLHFGEISIRDVWAQTRAAMRADPSLSRDGQHFLSELGWREFSNSLVYHFDDFPEESWKQEFRRFPWKPDDKALKAWQTGQTGYPIVDAGMRELWTTGWMHNRVRMIVGSFLVKHLLQDWRVGEAWFWDTLVDADIANNAAGWQWIAGSGADAAPYFRIFNPMTQGENFDTDGAYVRRWVPELARLPDAVLHRPFEAPAEILAAAGVRLGQTYPRPIVDHTIARKRALDALASLKDPIQDPISGENA
jgi:deoxyribodipyrimidine photo-lyase